MPSPAADNAPSALRERATGTMAWFFAVVGLLVVALSGTRLLWASEFAAALATQTASGLALIAAAVLARALLHRGRADAAAALLLFAAAGGFGLAAAGVGVGLHGVGVPGIALLIVMAGLLAGAAASHALALLYLATIGALAWAELSGRLDGAARLAALGVVDRVSVLLVLGLGAWLAALLARRVIEGSLQRVQQESARQAALVRMGSDWAWEMDRAGRMTWLSSSFEERTGQKVADFMRLFEPGGPQTIAGEGIELVQDDMRAGRPYRERQVGYRCLDGSELYVRGSGEPRRDAAGRITGWWGVSRNVTAEVLAQRERVREQRLLDRLVTLSPDAITVVRLDDGCVLLANPSFAGLVGRPEPEVVGRHGVELGLWDDWAPALTLRAALDQAAVVRDLRLPARAPDGSTLEMQVAAARFEWDGAPTAVLVARDISELERARREADAILDKAAVGIAFVRARRFGRVNPQFERIFGHPVGSLAGQPTQRMFPDAEAFERFARRSDTAQAAGRLIDIEHTLARPDGAPVTVRLRAQALDPQRPAEGGAIWIAEDVGETRRAEQELADAKRLAEAANEAKSSFLATMSHEIRTPLNGVLGLARLLQDPSLEPARRQDYLNHLVQAAEGLAGIVSDVLDLSKIEAGELEVEQIPFDLRELAGKVFGSFALLGRERGLGMALALDARLPARVLGDPLRVRQILANYLSNALKFTAEGRITLSVQPAGAGLVRLEVSDSGQGITPEARRRLFRPFAQADSSTTRRFGGTGLGLSICRDLAERMGGTVGVESTPGRGSSFWAELPLPSLDEPGTPAPAPDGTAGAPLRGRRLLVAEDNAVNLLIIGTLLRDLGAEVVEVGDGESAVQAVQSAVPGFDAVLMDLHMPVVDGLEATRRLRADPRSAALPVFALSAAVLERDREHARAAGMSGFIAKPVAEVDLVRALSGLLRKP